MGATADAIASDVATILSTTWNSRDGQVVPKSEDVALANGAVKLTAVFLYADLAHSTTLARRFPNSVAAKIVRAYLASMTKLIKHNGGVVRSFDGDRVMGVFVGDNKNTAAAKCALQMNHTVRQVLKPKAEAKFPSLEAKDFKIRHCAGAHRSEVLVVRGGVRGSNDLVFIGEAPNFAAKLSDIRNYPNCSYITHQVHSNLHKSSKYGPGGEEMWTKTTRKLGGEDWTCYWSSWWWKP